MTKRKRRNWKERLAELAVRLTDWMQGIVPVPEPVPVRTNPPTRRR